MSACQKIRLQFYFGGGIWALWCSDDSIQTLLILPQFITLWTEAKLEGFVWGHQSIKVLISHPQKQFPISPTKINEFSRPYRIITFPRQPPLYKFVFFLMLLGKAYPLQTKMIKIYTHLVFRPKRFKYRNETYLVIYRYYMGVLSSAYTRAPLSFWSSPLKLNNR